MSDNSQIPEDKTGLRAWARQKLRHQDTSAASGAIVAQIIGLPEFIAARRVLLYLALPHEVNLEAIVSAEESSGKLWYAPRCAPRRQLLIYPFDPRSTELKTGAFGIREPDAETSPNVDPSVLDLVFVPGLLYTRRGERLGNGGGYYDRFLMRLSPDCAVVGIAANNCIVDTLPTDPWDVRVNVIVTNTNILRAPAFS